ncbi:MAG: hypothetical protein K2X46_01705 [Roseomonas sp.]|nr:hypothetical protein [Roseomonas sp.]
MAEVFPGLDPESLPQEERSEIFDLQIQITSLRSYVDDFLAVLTLFDAVPNLEAANKMHAATIRRWSFVAARDGAMTIYHFGKALELVRSLKNMPTLRSLVNVTELREAGREFNSKFPLYEKIRHAVAHSAERLRRDKRIKHSFSGTMSAGGIYIENSQNVRISSNLYDREFGYTVEGVYVSYSVSHETYSQLAMIQQRVWRAFDPACHKFSI